jgi:sugar transferase (PEP-CTERM/EpsH1 system associated)
MTPPLPASTAGGATLFLAHRVPFPPDRGDKMRSFHMLKALAELGPVHLIAFTDDARDEELAAGLDAYVASRLLVRRTIALPIAGLRALTGGAPYSLASFEHPRIAARVTALLDSGAIDRIFVFSGQMAQYVPVAWLARTIVDFGDVDSAKFGDYAAASSRLSPMRAVYAREDRELARFEARIARYAARSLFVSEAEAALFRARSGLSDDKVAAVDNGIDLDFYDPAAAVAEPDIAPGPLVVFTGQMDYRPNIEAVERFARQVLPRLRIKAPGARFAIVGRNPAPRVCALDRLAGVIVTGAVDDVRSWLVAADVVVAPLQIARGVQNKVLEAMAMAKPIVVSPAAAQGIDAQDGEHFIVADSAGAQADAVAALIADPPRAAELGQAARARVEARYAWGATLAPLVALLEALPRATA